MSYTNKLLFLLSKKQQTLDWKKHRALGIDYDQPERVKHPSKSLSNIIEQPTSSLIQQSTTPLIHIQQQQHFHDITHENNLVKIDSPSHLPIQIEQKPEPTNPFSPQSNQPNQPIPTHNQPNLTPQSQQLLPNIELHKQPPIVTGKQIGRAHV